jgi:hypothetical protein
LSYKNNFYFWRWNFSLVAVGWLGEGSEFTCGSVSSEFFDKLKNLCADPWQPVVAAGCHSCELCQFDAPRFSSNVFIPYKGKIFVAPVGIVHYIAAHRYLPPPVFIEAVVTCPPIHSMEYKKALLSNGGRSLVKATIAPNMRFNPDGFAAG